MTTIAALRTRPARWDLADVVDFEHFLAEPGVRDEDGPLVHQRLGPAASAGPGPADPATRRMLLRAWVDLQRERHAPAATPGARLQQGVRLLGAWAWLLGLLAGALLAGVWLSAGAGAPVNAPLFWAATVGVQMLLLVLALAGWAWRHRVPQALPAGGWQGLVQGLVAAAGRLRGPQGAQRAALQAALARLAQRPGSLARLLAWPAVALAQRFGVAFNLGLLLAMLVLHLPLVDVRFGWQSTYPISAAQMQQAVHWIATPWRWVWPQAQPTTAQLLATRYAPGQPPHTLPAEAARAWWPFLAASVACYGLLLRAGLLLLAWLAQRRRLARLRLDHPEALALHRRLAGTPVQATGGAAQLPPAGPPPAIAAHAAGPCIALVAPELALPDETVRTAVPVRFGPLQALHRLPVDDRAAAAPVLAGLAAGPQRPALVLVLVPVARDPIVAVAQFLRAVVQAAGPGVEVLVLLVPDAPAVADPLRLAIWQRFVQIQQLGVNVAAWASP